MTVFDADAISLHKLFISEGNTIGFRIPEYQRTYDWGDENIQRYFEDLLSGLKERAQDGNGDQNSLTFLGTIILVDEGTNRENSFDGRSFSVVDGQQRLTTAALVALHLHNTIAQEIARPHELSREVAEWLRAESLHVSKRLTNCVYGNLVPDGVNNFPYPRIVRHGDARGPSHHDSEYASLVSKYLFGYAGHVREQRGGPFQFARADFSEGTSERFFRNVDVIQQFILDVASGDEESSSDLEFVPLVSSDFRRAPIQRIFEKLPEDQNSRNRVISTATDRFEEGAKRLLRLLSFAVYALDSVLVTRVQTREEKYAFDIFDALNTTGEPLTAIETFKPRITLFESQHPRRGYDGSPSQASLEVVESYLSSFQKNADRQSAAQDIVVSFALYLTGEKCSRHLNVQRRYLRSKYNSIDEASEAGKRRFVRSLADISEYRKLFWTNNRLDGELLTVPDREQVLLCLDLLKEMKHSLSIPVICRYYAAAKYSGDFEQLADAIKAVTAFTVLRRSATGGTAAIDSDYRSVMHHGSPDRQLDLGLHIGVNGNRALAPIDTLKEILCAWLSRRPIYITDMESWLEKARIQGLYQSSTPLCRFLLLAAAHNSRPSRENPARLEKMRPSPELDYLSYRRWDSTECATVEHIAPHNDRERNWDQAIYAQPHLRHSIGNLTLLPSGENSAVGNRAPEHKFLFYRAFAAEGEEEVQSVIEEAERGGISFGRSRQMLLDGRQLPFARTIAAREHWDADAIQDRTDNILRLVWTEISEWLYE